MKNRRTNIVNRLTRLLIIGLVALLLVACGNSTVAPTPTPTPNPALEAAKVDTVLLDLLAAYQTGGVNAARDYARKTGLVDDQDRVRFMLTLSSPAAAPPVSDKIKQMGGEVYTSDNTQLGVLVDLNKLTTYFDKGTNRNFFQELAAFQEVRELKVLLRPALTQVVNSNQGVSVTGANRWQKAGYSGRGITVGIIDGGFKGYRNWLGKALPVVGQVELKSFLLGDGEDSENHGTAVAEIVHSLAPDARLILIPIEDEIGFTRAVQYLIDRQVQVIQISLGWGGLFPGDGTGKLDEKLDQARQAGILPVVSTGNYGESHYQGTFKPGPNNLAVFDNGQTTLKLSAEDNLAWVALRWNENWDAPKTNLDLYILDSNQKVLVSSRNLQGVGPKPPTELATFKTANNQTHYIQIRLAGSPPEGELKFDLFAYNARLENATAEGSIATPGDARGALGVGAVDWATHKVENYSSRGPTRDGRAKPDLMGPTNISSQVFGQNFGGTSASAPQVSGVAALVWSAAPGLTANQVSTYLTRNANDLEPQGRDDLSGWGEVMLGSEQAAQGGIGELLGAVPAGPAFEDSFAAASSGLPNNSQAYYDNGPAYVVKALPGKINWNTYLSQNFEEFRAEVEVTPTQGAFYGLVFWQQALDDYYSWLITGNRYAILKRSGTGWLTLLDWSQDASLSSPSVRLSLEATGSYLRLRANNTVLQNLALKPGGPIPPPGKLGGKFGFGAGLFGTTPVSNQDLVVKFSHLNVTPLTSR